MTPQGRPVKDGDLTLWARKLTGGDVAVALYNEDDVVREIGFDLETVGWGAGRVACVRDLWAHADVSGKLDRATGKFAPEAVAPHEAKMYRVSEC